jgi:hypothetical protein
MTTSFRLLERNGQPYVTTRHRTKLLPHHQKIKARGIRVYPFLAGGRWGEKSEGRRHNSLIKIIIIKVIAVEPSNIQPIQPKKHILFIHFLH